MTQNVRDRHYQISLFRNRNFIRTITLKQVFNIIDLYFNNKKVIKTIVIIKYKLSTTTITTINTIKIKKIIAVSYMENDLNL